MRILKSFQCLLILGLLFFLGACQKGSNVVSCDYSVTINSCNAIPPKFDIQEGKGVCWQGSDQDYTIAFPDTSEPTANPLQVKKGTTAAHLIKGHKGCVPLGRGTFYCEYSVTKGNEDFACADPGIRIVP
jgi:hypothetical protein